MNEPASCAPPAARRRDIIALLTRDGALSTSALAARFGVSEDAVRRDLRDLARAGMCVRVHGGALPASPAAKEYIARKSQGGETRERIAQAAAGLVENGSIVLFDSGTAVREAAARIRPDIAFTAVTASPDAALTLAAHPGAEVILLGGRLLKSPMTAAGAQAVAAVREIRADLCLMGVCGLRPDIGLTAEVYEEVPLKKAYVDQSADVAVLAGPEKLGVAAPFTVAPLSRLTHLIAADADEETLAPFRAAGLEIIEA